MKDVMPNGSEILRYCDILWPAYVLSSVTELEVGFHTYPFLVVQRFKNSEI